MNAVDYRPVSICSRKVDIGFVVDASGSVRYHFDKVKDFVKAIHVEIRKHVPTVRFGVLAFSHIAVYYPKLKSYNYRFFDWHLNKVNLLDNVTRIDRALQATRDEVFLLKNGHRAGAKKIVILVTDGQQTNVTGATEPALLAEELRKNNMLVIILGVIHIDRQLLENLDNENDYLFYAGTLNGPITKQAKKVSGLISDNICAVQWRRPYFSCKHRVDIVFIIDSSGSLKGYFDAEKYFIVSIAEAFNLADGFSKTSIVRFSSTAEIEIHFTDFQDIEDFEDAVEGIPYDGGLTRIDLGMLEAEKEMMEEYNRGRLLDTDVLKFVVLITDGKQNSTEPVKIAERLRRQGIKVIVLGVGSVVNEDDLQAIAGPNNKWWGYHNFEELIRPSAVNNMKVETCSPYLPYT